MLLGVICGLINGLMIAKLKLPDFIVTLGMLSIYRGAALIYTDGRPIYGIDERFRSILPANSSVFRHRCSWPWRYRFAAFLLVRYTALGEQIIAVGGNEEAARLSGINTDRVKICVYAISGLLSSIAGFVLIGRLAQPNPLAVTVRVAGDWRSRDWRRQSVWWRGQPSRFTHRRADPGRHAERLDANECAVVLAISSLPAQSSSWPSLSTKLLVNASDE